MLHGNAGVIPDCSTCHDAVCQTVLTPAQRPVLFIFCPKTGIKSAGCILQAVTYQGASIVMLESGTRNPAALPSALYGCPYPSTSNGDCKPPASCNCYQVGNLSLTLELKVVAQGCPHCL